MRTALMNENQIAVTADVMQLTSVAEARLENAFAALKGCKVSVDDDSLKNIKFYLDQIHQKLAGNLSGHLDAQDEMRAAR